MPAFKKKRAFVNLLPQNAFEASLAGRILKWVLSTFRVIVIFVEIVVIAGFVSRFWLDLRLSDLNDEIQTKKDLILSYSSFEKDFRSTQQKLSIFSDYYGQKNEDLLTIINEVARRLPPDIQLTSVSREAGKTEIMGSTLSEQSIAQFIANLQAEPGLSNIKLSNMDTKENSILINFTLTSDTESKNQTGGT